VISDPAIPTLPAVLDPRQLGEHLRQSLPLPTSELNHIEVRPLRHHPGKRCVVEVTCRTGAASLGLIGKVYAKDRSDVYRLMEKLRRAGFGAHQECSIPQPTAYLPALHLLLQEKVEGRPATDSLLSNDEAEAANAAERCAKWLAAFHATAPRMGPRLDLHGHLLAMERWVGRLASLGGPLATKARKLFKRLEAVAPQVSHRDMRTVHGDYTHHQVIMAPGRTVTVDWDKYRLADPHHDAARFVVGLQRLALRCRGSLRALDAAAGAFLTTYAASHRSVMTGRLAFHTAAICLEHAKHDVHKQAPGWRERAAATLDEGLRVVRQGP
jgi:aminoglycoside phosphotransferase (APT) family kinase protein